jgi:hypothetical protein
MPARVSVGERCIVGAGTKNRSVEVIGLRVPMRVKEPKRSNPHDAAATFAVVGGASA